MNRNEKLAECPLLAPQLTSEFYHGSGFYSETYHPVAKLYGYPRAPHHTMVDTVNLSPQPKFLNVELCSRQDTDSTSYAQERSRQR